MCRFFLPVWLLLGVLFVAGCGAALKFGYTAPATFTAEILTAPTVTSGAGWTLTPLAASPAPAPATRPSAPTTQTTAAPPLPDTKP